jgi:flagellar biosynthetic protein FliP
VSEKSNTEGRATAVTADGSAPTAVVEGPTRHTALDASSSARPTWRVALTNRAFIVHYLEMVAAMEIGMVVLGPLSMRVAHHAGAEVETLLMASTMVPGMVVCMALRRHVWPAVAEMCVAMYLSFLILFPAYWLGLLDATRLPDLGHIIMLAGMAVAMLRRREAYIATSRPGIAADH